MWPFSFAVTLCSTLGGSCGNGARGCVEDEDDAGIGSVEDGDCADADGKADADDDGCKCCNASGIANPGTSKGLPGP